jgi:hypothetical protein
LEESIAHRIGSSAGWLLSAYFLGGYGDDAKGSNGVGNAVTVTAKSWAVGIPVIIFHSCSKTKIDLPLLAL